MYIRTTSRKNKDGTVATYVQLAHNEWDPEKRRSTTKVLFNLGREEDIDKEGLKRLIDSIVRYLGPDQVQLDPTAPAESPRFISSRTLGGSWLLDQLWEKLGIKGTLQDLLEKRSFRTPVERAIFAMIANRALNPSSKLAIEDWVREDVYISGLEDVNVQNLYRAMDFLLEHSEEIQKEVYFSVANLMNLEVDLLYFDTTSTYFEVEEDSPEDDKRSIRRQGNSKDHRPDRPQTVIGLAVTREGIPVRCWSWPGNTADMSVVDEVKKDLCGWKLGRVISVMDRGFASEDNFKTLQRGGGHYIVGEKMRSGKESVETALSKRGRFTAITETVEVKEIIVGDGEKRIRYVLVRNPKEAKRDAATREKHIKRIEEELQAIGELNGDPHTKAVCKLIAHPTYGRYIKTGKQGQPKLDKAKIKAEERLDGKYLIRTSDDTLSVEDVALGYKQLLQVEDSFRTLKQDLELRPVYHQLSDRIKSHVLLCFLALLLIRVAENEADDTWRNIRDTMERMCVIEYFSKDGRILQRTETTPLQMGILKALSLKEPPKVLELTPPKRQIP